MIDRPGMFRTWQKAAPFLCAVALSWALIIGGLAYFATSMAGAP